MRPIPRWHDYDRQSNWFGPPDGVHGTQPGWDYGLLPGESVSGLTFYDWRGTVVCRITAGFLQRVTTETLFTTLQRKGIPFPFLVILDTPLRIGNNRRKKRASRRPIKVQRR